jgi:hypothetical protein
LIEDVIIIPPDFKIQMKSGKHLPHYCLLRVKSATNPIQAEFMPIIQLRLV